MNRKIQTIPLELLKLDQENVRFGGDVALNQREAIELMMSDPEDAKKLLKLAEHIGANGLDPTELQLVIPDESGSYIVVEGNRRLTALKLIQKPDLCPVERLVKRFKSIHDGLNGQFPREIECGVVPSRESSDKWVELKHTGMNQGVGRVNWDSNIRDERRARQTGVESIGRQVRNIVRNNPKIFSEETIKDIFEIDVTTLTRLFSSKPAQDIFQLKVVNKYLEAQVSLQFIAPSLEFAINLFSNEGYNVNDVRNDDDRKRFLSHIPPELDPKKLAISASEVDKSSKKVDSSAKKKSDTADSKEKNNQTSDKQRTRARPTTKARKYLLPWSLNIDNSRINDVYRELRKDLLVDKCPNATAITFRVFIEVSCDAYIEGQKEQGIDVKRVDNKKPISQHDKLSSKVVAVAHHLEELGLLSKDAAKAVKKRADSKDKIGSVDHFNQFIHSSSSAPLPSELKDIASEYRPFLEAIWK